MGGGALTIEAHPQTFVKDSTKIKSKLAAVHPGSVARVHVDADDHGVVWRSGPVRSHPAHQKERLNRPGLRSTVDGRIAYGEAFVPTEAAPDG
jgi:hypothetical protein